MFSLIIPCYNELENLKFHKDKFYNFVKFYKSYELIFVDNGSSDNSYNYLKDNFPNYFCVLDERIYGISKIIFARILA